MGNFYTNIVVTESRTEAVTAAVEALERRAYVVTNGRATLVFDERCDRQDVDELQRLAGMLSKQLHCAALAFCNHDDDILWYALAQNGQVVDTYDSFPGYFTGGSDTPKGGDAARLCAAFNVPNRERAVAELLRRRHKEFIVEIDRHSKLLELLDLPVALGMLGYNYVSQGELTAIAGGETLRAIGGAPKPEPAGVPPNASGAAPPIDPRVLAARQAEGAQLTSYSAALAFNRVDVPPRYAHILGSGSVRGFVILLRLQRYLNAHELVMRPSGFVQADDMIAEMLGEREFQYMALARLVVRAFGVPPLSPDETAALQAGDPTINQRFFEAMRRGAEEFAVHDPGVSS